MGCMAFTAGHLAKAYWATGCLEEFRTFFFMAVETHFGLGFLFQYGVFSSVYGVTTGAGDVAAAVCAAQPVNMLAVLMTAKTGCILFFYRFVRLDAKVKNWWAVLPWPHFANVAAAIQYFLHSFCSGYAWTMTGFTL